MNEEQKEWLSIFPEEDMEGNSTSNTRLKCLEIASNLKTENGEPMTMKELLGKAEELFNFIQKK